MNPHLQRSGIGFDVHPLAEGRALILGGVKVPFEKGLLGHSDGDVLIHAIIDALLGGAGLGDIGTHFPSSDGRYKNLPSTELLAMTLDMVHRAGWHVSYIDATMLAERPLLGPFIDQIQHSIASVLGVDNSLINIKAKTTDGLGFIGKGEGCASLAITTLESP